jgi:predicted amidohydrolase YtcJ
MNTIKIPRSYDSHLHLIATGEMHAMASLRGLTEPKELQNLKVQPQFFRGPWLLGFGWDQHLFPNQEFPSRRDLDMWFPNIPVAFSRIDGHALWLNTCGLKQVGYFRPVSEWNLPQGAVALSDSEGMPTGVLLDRAMDLVFKTLPPLSATQTRQMIELAQQELNQAGFTHVRDMSGPPLQWEALVELEEAKELKLFVEQNFTFEAAELFEPTLERCLKAKKDRRKQIRARGIKFYLDGALGSEGAALSQNYQGRNHSGFLIWPREQIKEWVIKSWECGLEVSVHAIGDRASDLMVEVACELWESGHRGLLNLEHCQVMNPVSLSKLKGKSVNLYFQPCHWLSDRAWVDQKIPALKENLFQWRKAYELGLSHFWGSDTPIEKTSLAANFRALCESQLFIPPYPDFWWKPHVHPDPTWGESCFTLFNEETAQVEEVWFQGQRVV